MALTDTEIKKAKPLEVSVPGHALRCRPETSVTSPLRGLWFELSGHEKTYIQPSRPWEGWGAGFMAFHAFHTLSFPWPAFRAQMLDKPIRRHAV
jgi:hypothetical protein